MEEGVKHIGDSLFAGDVSPASLQRALVPITRPVLAWLGVSLTLGQHSHLRADKTAKAQNTAPAKCTHQFSLYLPALLHLTLVCQLPPGLISAEAGVTDSTGQSPASAQPRISGVSSLRPWPLLTSSHLSSPQQPLMCSLTLTQYIPQKHCEAVKV